MATSISISSRLSRSSKKDLQYAYNNATSTALVSKLRQDGQLNTVESVMHAIEQVSSLLTSGFDGQIKDSILNMCQHLKVYGACLEVLYKEQLDRAFVVFRNSSQDEKVDYTSRLHLLELIELRANQWKSTDVMSHYYKKKIHNNDSDTISMSDSVSSMLVEPPAFISPITSPLLGPGEIMKASGKFAKPTRIPGKNYCKDEVVIRNADSGKVMGIKGRRVHMIEELSETIISFQRVNPGAKERLVQITGANESSINHAKQLIEDTIRRNASPIRDPNAGVGALAGSSSSINSSASEDSALPALAPPRTTLLHSLSTSDATVGEYKYTVVTGGHVIKITGANLDLVRASKIILDDFFTNPVINGGEFYNFETLPRSPISPQDSMDTESLDVLSNGDEQTSAQDITAEFKPEATSEQKSKPSEYKPLRKPNIVDDEIQANTLRRPNILPEDIQTIPTKDTDMIVAENKGESVGVGVGVGGVRYVYDMKCLVRMSMSPLCLQPPEHWTHISHDHPLIARKVLEVFDADQYLSNRETSAHVLCTSASDESILSGSSV